MLARVKPPFVPSYPLAKPGKAQSFMPANVATREQFNARDSRFSYHPEFAQNVFINNANAVDYLRAMRWTITKS